MHSNKDKGIKFSYQALFPKCGKFSSNIQDWKNDQIFIGQLGLLLTMLIIYFINIINIF